MWLAKILSFSFLNPFVKYTKHPASQWVEELDLQNDYEKGFISTRMFFFAYVLLTYTIVPMFSSLSLSTKKKKYIFGFIYNVCVCL